MSYSPWYWHNKALREHPEYQMEGMMDCLREEMMMNMPIAQAYQGVEQPEVTYKSIYFKMDRGAFELNRRVSELENANKYLLETIKGMRANASKRKTNRYNIYTP